jgi:hypothetical protein
MRGRITALAAAGLLAVVVAGCGGSDNAAMQVPGPPADVTVPQSDTAPGSGSGNGASATATPTTTATPDSSTGGGTSGDTGTTTGSTGTGTTGDTNGATAAPDTSTDSATNDTPPPDGSNAQQFEDFCAQNPGAC